jgi:uncharacterized damage-inducible protein DinB
MGVARIDEPPLDALLDSWDRSNTILINLLRLVPEGALDVRSGPDGPSVGELFAHMHYVRMVFIEEDTPEFAKPLPEGEWRPVTDRDQIASMLDESANAVGDAVNSRLQSGRPMELHYDHPILMLQHMLWHEGYHHGQIKLALKLAGSPISDRAASPGTWGVWMRKTR